MEMKKTIVIEAQRIFRRKKHGMDFVALELIRELQKIDTHNSYIIAVGPGEDICLTETDNFKIEVLRSTNYMFWEQILLPRLLTKYKADLLHCTSNTAPILIKTPLVLTLHDIIFMEDKMGNNASTYQKLGRIYRRFVVPFILKKVRQIITVSNFEKVNILARYPNLEHITHAIYNGVGKEFVPPLPGANETFQDLLKGSYWLFLGNTDPKKNMRNTLLGFAQYLEVSMVKRNLLLLDTDLNALDKLLEELNISSIRPYLTITGYISHDQLPQCYANAFAFLYTSLRESFGLPLIEAMACGTPVIGSNTSAIPEVAGKSVIYVDPNSPHSIAEAMILLENDSLLYNDLIQQGLVHSKNYAWRNTATQTLLIYKSVLL